MAFMCYARDDDQYGHLSEFRERLESAVRDYGHADFSVFQDKRDMQWGAEWERQRDAALDNSIFLLPIITPRFFKSEECRKEVERFTLREAALGRDDLILPVYYIETPEWEADKDLQPLDSLAVRLAKRERSDWREIRNQSPGSSMVRTVLDGCARRLVGVIRSLSSVPPAEVVTHSLESPATSPRTEERLRKPFLDLRRNFITGLVRKLARPDSLHVLFVSGSRGVGKTHLCESVASVLVRVHDAQAHSFNIVRESRPLYARIANALFPAAAIGAPAELATLLANDLTRRIIHISNCQDLSVPDMLALASLFTELDLKKWGRVQFLLESRPQSYRSDWHTLVKQICNNLPGCQATQVQALKPHRIIAVIDSLFLTPYPREIAQALVAKVGSAAGVNPYILINVIQHMISQGAFQWKEFENREYRLIVNDHRFAEHLDDLPDELRSLLRERIEQFEPTALDPRDTRLPYAERLAVLASAGPDFDRTRVAHALAVEVATLDAMDAQLSRGDLLKYTGTDDRVDFCEDIMRLAAQDFGREATSFIPVAERLIASLDQRIPREHILAGTLYGYLLRDEKARSCFRAVLQRAKQADDFPLQKIALDALTQTAEPGISAALDTKAEWIRWLTDLGWNEMQSGSQTLALRYYERAMDSASELLNHGGDDETRLLQKEGPRIQQRILTCLLNRQRVNECMDLLESLVLKIEDQEREQLFDALNRFLLLCFATGQAAAGHRVAQLGWRMAESLGSESRSVILSDIGHLFLFDHPAQAMRLWQDCLEAAQTTRQFTHAQTNLLIARLLGGVADSDPGYLDSLLSTIQTQTGTSIQLARINMYVGARWAIDREWEKAETYFELAKSNAMMSGQVSHEWEADNNLGVTYAALNKPKEARRAFALAASRAHSLITDLDAARTATIFSSFEQRAASLFPSSRTPSQDMLSQDISSASTGTIWYLLHNLRALEGTLQVDLPQNFWNSVDPSAFERSRRRSAADSNRLRVSSKFGVLSLALA